MEKIIEQHFAPLRSREIAALNPLENYKKYCHTHDLTPHPAQLEAMRQLQSLYEDLEHHEILDFLAKRLALGKPPQGIYLHGAPGAGKSMMMDLFFDAVPSVKKINLHFHQFMLIVHQALADLRRTKNPEPLKTVGKQLAAVCRLLCLDEVYVSDVADALILRNLFQEIFKHDIVLVATGNFAPEALYPNGIQRDQFLPFVDLLYERCRMLPIDTGVDYRTTHDAENSLWLLNNAQGRRQFLRLYHTLSKNEGKPKPNHKFALKKQGREILLDETKGRILRTSFASLCNTTLYAADYLALSEQFDSFFIEDIPLLTQSERNELKRFVVLVDILYNGKKNLIGLAAAPPDALYRGSSHKDEFERTVSRLLEMETEQWINRKSP